MRNAEKREADHRIFIGAALAHGGAHGWLTPGEGRSEWFQDDAVAPRMVVVPSGQFTMGSAENEPRWPGYDGREQPAHRVEIGKAFAVGAAPVTRRELAVFLQRSGHIIDDGAWVWKGRRWWAFYLDKNWRFDPERSWRNPGFAQDDNHPAVCVSWLDAQAYCAWLGKLTGHAYRLLSEAEWEFCCRAGTTTAYSTGHAISSEQSNLNQTGIGTTPVMQYQPNPWGLFDMHGNVWEWVEDDWHESYAGAPPRDGSPWRGGDAELRGLRGGAWDFGRVHFRSADRGRGPRDLRNNMVGFRVAREV